MYRLQSKRAKTIVLVGYQDQGNLGLGYLASYLLANGYEVEIVDFKQSAEDLFRTIRSLRPIAVGFSLIFQHYFLLFAELLGYLRSRGIDCHMTMGGHYPSLCHESVLRGIPELDSIVLFEGELTLLELADNLRNHSDWRNIQGIAYRANGQIRCNRVRPLISDLDTLPNPYRPGVPDTTLGQVMFPIAATRGCVHRCAFCSIREFYERVPGPKVRRRSPGNVAAEMQQLYRDRHSKIFLFQDDNFPMAGRGGRDWVDRFIQALKDLGLYGKVIWKISCRVDEVDPILLSRMMDAGLYLVYLGIESGTRTGLKTLNKQVRVADNLRAISVLKQLGLLFSYGYMLFDPGSTFHSVKGNIRFLRQIVGDGSAAVIYCKMLPYAGTPIARNLADSGRLYGSCHQPDYRFSEPGLNDFYDRLYDLLTDWIHDPHSVSRHVSLLWHELAVVKALLPELEGTLQYESRLRINTWKSNQIILDLLQTTLSAYEKGEGTTLTADEQKYHAKAVIDQLLEMRDLYVHANKEILMAALHKPHIQNSATLCN